MTRKKRTATAAGNLSTALTPHPVQGSARLVAAAILSIVAAAGSPAAHALSLGRLTVLSSLGEPLRAEIEVSDLSAAESESLNVQTASPAAFRAAGIEFNPALTGARVAIERRGDGRSMLRITGSRAVNEPFLDVLLDASWASGRVSRSYTVLLDPPSSNVARSAAQVAPQIAAAPPRAPAVAAEPPPINPSSSYAGAAAAARRPAPPPPAPAPRVAAAPSPAPAPPGTGTAQVAVRPGDTAGRIAATYKPASVSLDQMLVAMLQANPEAFVNGNVNRIRAGAVLSIPDAAQAAGTPDADARQTVVAQSRDFNEFRRRLAARAPAVETAAPQRAASGTVQTQVEDRRPAAATPDRLTLSKGSVRDAAQAEQIAQASQSRDSAARVAEISRNLSELNRLGADGTAAPSPVAPPGAAVPAASAAAAGSAPTPGRAGAPVLPGSSPTASPAASSTKPAAASSAAAGAIPGAAAPNATPSAPTTPAVAPAASGATDGATPTATAGPGAAGVTPQTGMPVPAPAPVPPAAAADEPSFLATVLEDVRLLAGLALLALLVAALLAYRALQRKRAAQNDSRFLESKLPQDSFFGASGGQHVDTTETAPSSLATTYSPSQLDAGGDVDPLAEADVYLAYGRDSQAEEILKEALKNQPTRTAIHAKLADLYARRKDVTAFNGIALEAHRLTAGTGDDWQRIRGLGLEVDPSNPLYRSAEEALSHRSADTGAVAAGMAVAALVAPAAAATLSADTPKVDVAPPVAPAHDLGLDVDLDSDRPAEDAPTSTVAPVEGLAPSLDFGFADPSLPPPSTPPAPATAVDDAYNLEFSLDDLDDLRAPSSPPAASVSEQPLAFDLSALSLDLDDNPPPQAAIAPVARPADAPRRDAPVDDEDDFDTMAMPTVSNEDALATKLALAHEFTTIGDADGARHLIEEVIAESSGTVRTRAERMLAALD